MRELYEKNITQPETNMGLGLGSTVFGASACKASNGIQLILPSAAAAEEFH